MKKEQNIQEPQKPALRVGAVMQSLPDWYKALSLLELQMKALQEDIPRNLVERRGDVTDLETFDMKLTAMRNRLHRAFEELKGNVAQRFSYPSAKRGARAGR